MAVNWDLDLRRCSQASTSTSMGRGAAELVHPFLNQGLPPQNKKAYFNIIYPFDASISQSHKNATRGAPEDVDVLRAMPDESEVAASRLISC